MRTSLWLAFAVSFLVVSSAPAQQAGVPAAASVAALLQKHDEAMTSLHFSNLAGPVRSRPTQ